MYKSSNISFSSSGSSGLSTTSGGIHAHSRLARVRSNILDMSKKIRDLEGSLILFLVNPELVLLIEKSKEEDDKEGENNSLYINVSQLQSPNDILGNLLDARAMKYELDKDEYFLIQDIEEIKKADLESTKFIDSEDKSKQ